MRDYILAIDQGTTSSRAIIFDKNGKLCWSASKPLECIYPKPGWVEQDALEILKSTTGSITDVLINSNLNIESIDSIGITNQRETTIIWDKKTGIPVYNAIVWQSRQSQYICDAFMDKEKFIQSKTGLKINPYFSASKIRFILDSIENGQKRAENGELLFGTVDTWLIYKLTGGKSFFTDVTNASRTMLFNIFDLCWDKELCDLFNIPLCMLPEVKECSADFGELAGFKCEVHITGVAGDQQAALFGQNCFEKGEAKNTYGTGCFMLANIGDKPVISKKGLLTTIASKVNGKISYALEGSVFIGGAVMNWLQDEVGILDNVKNSEEYCKIAKSSKGVYFVPAFVGLGTPYWDNDVRGSIFGLTRGSNKYQITRAAIEGIAYQCKDVFEVMKKDAHISLKSLRVDGGAVANNYLDQFQSDILNCTIMVPSCLETTALGACYLAGLFTGFFASVEEIKCNHKYQKLFEPQMSKEEILSLYSGWKKAVKAAKMFK